MRHILQLKPDLIKLDREIIAGIDTDPAQRALGAAMVGFSSEIGAALVAEAGAQPDGAVHAAPVGAAVVNAEERSGPAELVHARPAAPGPTRDLDRPGSAPRRAPFLDLPEKYRLAFEEQLQRPGAITGAIAPYRALLLWPSPLTTRAQVHVAAPTTYLWSRRDPYLGRQAAHRTAHYCHRPVSLHRGRRRSLAPRETTRPSRRRDPPTRHWLSLHPQHSHQGALTGRLRAQPTRQSDHGTEWVGQFERAFELRIERDFRGLSFEGWRAPPDVRGCTRMRRSCEGPTTATTLWSP